MKYEQPTLELIELKIKDVMLLSQDGDSLIDGGEGFGEEGDYNQL